LLLVACTGCAVEIASWSAATPPGTPAGLARDGGSRGRFTGRSCRWWLLGVPFGLPRIEEAMADALARGRGTSLRNLTVISEHPAYGPVGRHCYAVKGDVVG
jgi:hypothetical protein